MKKNHKKNVTKAVALRLIEDAKRLLQESVESEKDVKTINWLSFAECAIKRAIRRDKDEDITRG